MTDQNETRQDDNARRYFASLIELQNEVTYVIECLGEDFRGEASRGMADVFSCLDRCTFPEVADEQIRNVLGEAVDAINARELILCGRKMQTVRRRLANEVASILGEKNPYAYCYYPLLSSEAEERKKGFIRLSDPDPV